MKDYEVTVKLKGNKTGITYNVRKTMKGAKGLAKRVANEAFYGEEVDIIITEI